MDDANSASELRKMLSFLDKLSCRISTSLEVRLFFVRLKPCLAGRAPEQLTLKHACRATGMSVEINGLRVSASDTSSLPLRSSHLHRDTCEVTYVSTDCVRITGGVDFELYEEDHLILRGSLRRLAESPKCRWVMDCHISPQLSRPPSVEVYIAGSSTGSPVILTKALHGGTRKQQHCTLDAIPEEEGMEMENASPIHCRGDGDFIDLQDGSTTCVRGGGDDDGQLSWFNAGVRVGLGIGIGMCVGIGMGLRFLVHSYQSVNINSGRGSL